MMKLTVRLVWTVFLVTVCANLGFGSSWNGDAAEQARRILEATGVQGGFAVHVGCNGGETTAALRANESYVVQGLDKDAGDVEKARRHIRSQGEYGPVSAEQWDGGRLPYADNLVNLLVAEKGVDVAGDEIMRVLAPAGVAYMRGDDGTWRKKVKPRPNEIGDWTHFLHDAGGNAVSHDRRVGPLKRLRWQAGPRWGRSHEHLPSLSAMVSAQGRVFYIIEDSPRGSVPLPPRWSLVARNAHNGVLLWRRPISEWAPHLNFFRTFPFQLVRRLVAVDDTVFVTLNMDAPVSALDAATGEIRATYAETKAAEEMICADGKLVALVNPSGKAEAFLPHIADGRFKLKKRGATVYNPLGPNPEKGERRRIVAVDTDTGRTAWKKDADTVYPRTLASANGRVFYQDGTEIVCLGLDGGKELWRTTELGQPIPEKPPMVSASLVARDDAVYYVDTYSGDKLVLTALSAKDGSMRWAEENELTGFSKNFVAPHHIVTDLMVADGLVWTALPRMRAFETGHRIGRDPATGEVKRRLEVKYDPQKINMGHHRCYRNKATDRYVLTGLDGIEFLDLRTGEMQYHNYVRGACNYGVMPANGLVYSTPDSCACNLHIRTKGLVAMASDSSGGEKRKTKEKEERPERRLRRGPAHGQACKSDIAVGDQQTEDWPTYRGDPARSGATPASGPGKLATEWRANLGGQLTAPTIGGGKVYVARVDTYTVHALDAASGERAWRFTAGARVDSPPTFHDGRVSFGSSDGYVYCLRASDGALAWRFRAAPLDSRIGVHGRIESAWPVHGSVLVRTDKEAPGGASVYCAAGRSAFLDGGIRLFRLDAASGEILAKGMVAEPDHWETGKSLLNVCGPNDVLSFSGGKVYMQHLAFDPEQLERTKPGRHLMSTIGFLDDSWWHRSYWLVGAGFGEGWGGWHRAGNRNPSGRLLALGGDHIYGFGRNKYPSGSTAQWARGEKYTLFATEKWSRKPRLTARALALAANALYIAGPPAFDYRNPGPDADKVFAGGKGGCIHMVDRDTGKVQAELELDAGPVFDALAVARDKVYISTVDGVLHCVGADD